MNRDRRPRVARLPDYRFPKTLRRRLNNGLGLLAVERPSANFAEFRLVVDGGFAADTEENSGLCRLAIEALAQSHLDGGRGRADRFVERMGATLCARARVDVSVLAMSAFAANLDAPLQALADIVIRPRLQREGLEATRLAQRAAIAREKTTPFDVTLRLAPALVYGAGDPYAKPFTGSGTESGLERISLDELRAFHREHFVPERATLVVAGPAIDSLADSAEKAFRGWRPDAHARPGQTPTPSHAESPQGNVTVVDIAGARQSAVFAVFATMPRASASAEAMLVADAILAGMFTSRLNMNLREAKGWTYGVRSFLAGARRRGLYIVYSFVQRERTAAAIGEIERELRAITDQRPPSREELSRAFAHLASRVPFACETVGELASLLEDGVACGLSDDYYGGFVERLRRLGTQDIVESVRSITEIKPASWLVLCDAASTRPLLESSGFPTVVMKVD